MAAGSMAKASTHEKVGHTGQGLWKHKGWQLPAYIQHVANDLKAKVGESRAVQMAVGIVKNWAAGHDGKGGKVSATTQAAARKAIAEWEALKARAGGGKGKRAGKSVEAADLVELPPTVSLEDLADMARYAADRLAMLERLDLPATGPIAQFDGLLVEAASFAEGLHPRDRIGRFRPKVGERVIVGDPRNVTRDVTATVKRIAGRSVHVEGPHGTTSHDVADVQPAGAGKRSTVPVPVGTTSASGGLFTKYDDKGLRTALADPQLTGRNRRQAERVARSRGIPVPTGAKRKVWMHSQTGHQFHEGDKVKMAGGEGTILGLVQKDGQPKVRVRTARGEFLVDPDSLRPATKARKLVEATAGKAARMPGRPAPTGSRVRAAGALGARDRARAAAPTAARDAGFETKHPRGGKGTPVGGKFVAKGSTGTEVRAVQRRVGARVDGQFGPMTEQAVRSFQQKHGLKVDGIIGRQTVAALRGRQDAKRVKVGALSTADRSFLAGHVRGKGRKRGQATATSARSKTVTTSRTPGGRTKTVTTLVEAVAAPAFLERVKGLELGEVARLPDGGAVKHHASEDGRAQWTPGYASRYGEAGVSWGTSYRTAEEAVADALTRSAGATDPAALGGPTRFSTYARVTVNGRTARFAGVTPEGRPLVEYDRTNGNAGPVAVTWAEITPAPRVLD